jgi:hypothetical protein
MILECLLSSSQVHASCLFWIWWFQSTRSNPIFQRYVLILSSHLCLTFQVVSFLRAFQPKCTQFYVHSACNTPRPFHLLDTTIIIVCGEERKLWSSSLRNFLQPPVASSLFGTNGRWPKRQLTYLNGLCETLFSVTAFNWLLASLCCSRTRFSNILSTCFSP